MLRALSVSLAALVASTLFLISPASADDVVPTPTPSEPTTSEPTPSVPTPSEPTPSTRRPTITVVGDSITAWFDDQPGSLKQGWWSMLGRDLGASVTTLAEGGSGMNVRGKQCKGTTFGQRLHLIEKTDFLIIQGGRNDLGTCTAAGVKKSLPRAKRRAGIERYLSRLGRRVDVLGIPRSHVLVVSPWGETDRRRGYQIQSYLRRFSDRRHEGFTYVETRTLPDRMRLDDKHPNRVGNAYLSVRMKRAILSLR